LSEVFRVSRSKMRAAPAFVAALVLCALAAFAPAPSRAQCPLCRTGLQQGGDKTARTMNLAILVLLIPPVSIFCTIFAVAYRRRNGSDDDADGGALEP
jgi:heme/copper-type cytochrome/quinol oxidase subunit 2